MIINKLHHGSDDSFTSFNDGFTFFFIDNPDVASTYGTNVYECSVDISNPYELDEGEDLERSASGTRFAGTSPTFKQFIRNVLHELPESDIERALEMYRRHGIDSVSPARIFLDRYDLLVKYLSGIGYDSIKFRDESMMGSSHGTFSALIVFNPSVIKIINVIIYDDHYGEVEKTYTASQWTDKLDGILMESFTSFLEHLKKYDRVLVESIISAHKMIFKF